MTTTQPFQGVPRPLVKTNQTVIVLSVVFAVLTHVYWILLLPILAGLSGIFLGKNFVILIAKHFLRKKPSEYMQEDKLDLRFIQIIATTLLSLSLISSLTGLSLLALLFAGMVFLAASVALSGFCVGCWLRFRYHQWKYRRKMKNQSL